MLAGGLLEIDGWPRVTEIPSIPHYNGRPRAGAGRRADQPDPETMDI
jgi:hypothetical protein